MTDQSDADRQFAAPTLRRALYAARHSAILELTFSFQHPSQASNQSHVVSFQRRQEVAYQVAYQGRHHLEEEVAWSVRIKEEEQAWPVPGLGQEDGH